MSKKKYTSPFQLQILTGTLPYRPSGWDDVQEAKPDPFLDEEEEIILPDGGTVLPDGDDFTIIPDTSGECAFDADEAYY